MRITSFMIFDQLVRGLREQLKGSANLNEQLATGKRINKPSDDVMNSMRALDYRLTISESEQFRRNSEAGIIRLRVTDTVIGSVSKILTNIRNIMALGVAGTQDPAIKMGFSQEVANYRNQLADLSASKYQNQYLFSGFRTDMQPYSAAPAYAYQGDNGIMNVRIDYGEAVAVNVTGTQVFSYSLSAPTVSKISSGRFVHYTPGAGTDIAVEIRASDDVTVLDNFTFSNVMQMTDILHGALTANNTGRIEALMEPFNHISTQVLTTQTDVGARLNRLQNQSSALRDNTTALQNALSYIEDADPLATAAGLKKLDAAIQALHESASRALSQSLLDFLR